MYSHLLTRPGSNSGSSNAVTRASSLGTRALGSGSRQAIGAGPDRSGSDSRALTSASRSGSGQVAEYRSNSGQVSDYTGGSNNNNSYDNSNYSGENNDGGNNCGGNFTVTAFAGGFGAVTTQIQGLEGPDGFPSWNIDVCACLTAAGLMGHIKLENPPRKDDPDWCAKDAQVRQFLVLNVGRPVKNWMMANGWNVRMTAAETMNMIDRALEVI